MKEVLKSISFLFYDYFFPFLHINLLTFATRLQILSLTFVISNTNDK